MHANHQPLHTVPILETERLVLKEIEMPHTYDVYQLFTDERVVKTFGYRMEPTLEDARLTITHWRKMLENDEGVRWGMYLKPTMALIGNMGFKNIDNDQTQVSIGYALQPYHWRKGYTFEALQTLIHYAFAHMGIRKIEATIFTNNISSENLLKKLGFMLTAQKPNNYFFDNDFHDVYVYTLENG